MKGQRLLISLLAYATGKKIINMKTLAIGPLKWFVSLGRNLPNSFPCQTIWQPSPLSTFARARPLRAHDLHLSRRKWPDRTHTSSHAEVSRTELRHKFAKFCEYFAKFCNLQY